MTTLIFNCELCGYPSHPIHGCQCTLKQRITKLEQEIEFLKKKYKNLKEIQKDSYKTIGQYQDNLAKAEDILKFVRKSVSYEEADAIDNYFKQIK